MANWCNLRLSAIGPPDDLASFRKAAGRLKGKIDAERSQVFLPEMQYGEGGDLTAHLPEPFARRFGRAEYTLQGRNDDYVDHFQAVSARFPALAFVLTFSDPNGDEHGSYLLLRGKRRTWPVPQRLHREIMRKHYKRWKLVDARGRVDRDAEEADWAEWDGFFEMMDVAAAHWDAAIIRWLRERHVPRRRRSDGKATRSN